MAARVASGRDIQPRLIVERRTASRRPCPSPPASFEAVRSGMDEVVNGNGTAGRSRLPFHGIRMAGKTGTAQVRNIGADRGRAGAAWRYRDHGLFVFFAPVGAPRYAGAVVIEHGLGGARAAAPVACDVLTYLFDKDKAMDAAAAARAGLGRQHRRADGAPRRGLGEPSRPARRRRPRCRPDGARLRPQADRRPALAGALDRASRIAAFGALGLYSTAPGGGGALMPYALPHAIRFSPVPR